MIYQELKKEDLIKELNLAKDEYSALVKEKISIDISRGKPCKEQLELSNELLNILDNTKLPAQGADIRNYGGLDGIAGMREIFAELLGVKASNVIVGNNSSLNMMYDTVQRCLQFGVLGSEPWNKQGKVKFICPAPGYDRHFAICEVFGIEMITVPMNENGPIMGIVEDLVANDKSIKGIWCVPKYSNPSGITYSSDVVDRLAKMNACEDFRIFWDNAYVVHDLYETSDNLKNIMTACVDAGNPDRVYQFTSTSKITFPGAGVACLATSEANVKDIIKTMQFQTIGPDKVNQYAHLQFLKNIDSIKAHMKKHANIIGPKFDKFILELENAFGKSDIAKWTKPNGGYFISLDVLNGCAKKVGKLCKEAGLVITQAGATYPYGKDDDDKNIRIAPTFTDKSELDMACRILIASVKVACLEKIAEKN